MLGIDYSFARPNLTDVKKKYGFVCRYLSHSGAKNITIEEAAAIRHQGLDLVLVWEDTAQNALKGKAQGVEDAKYAVTQANAIGWPHNLPIYFAVDFDATPEQQGAINQYFQGVCDVIGLDRTGVYGGFYVVERVANAHLAHWFWQTLAWSGGQVFKNAHIYQDGATDFAGGADVDKALQDNFGQWGFAAPPKPVPPTYATWGAHTSYASIQATFGTTPENVEKLNPSLIKIGTKIRVK